MGRALLVLDTPEVRAKAVHWIGKAPEGTRVEFKASKRTLPQNDMLWALLTEVSQQLDHGGTKYETGQWKAIFLHAFGREVSFLPSLDRKTFLPLELSSSDLSKDEMTDFIEFIMKEASERGVIFKDHRQTDNTNSGEAPLPEPDTADDTSTLADQAADGEGETTASPSAAAIDAMEWLGTAARMLWAATNVGGDTEANLDTLNAQRLAVGDLCPAATEQTIKDKAGSIYRQCKAVVMSEVGKPIALKFIAGVAGIDEKELVNG
jgi:hypothetical protein